MLGTLNIRYRQCTIVWSNPVHYFSLRSIYIPTSTMQRMHCSRTRSFQFTNCCFSLSRNNPSPSHHGVRFATFSIHPTHAHMEAILVLHSSPPSAPSPPFDTASATFPKKKKIRCHQVSCITHLDLMNSFCLDPGWLGEGDCRRGIWWGLKDGKLEFGREQKPSSPPFSNCR